MQSRLLLPLLLPLLLLACRNDIVGGTPDAGDGGEGEGEEGEGEANEGEGECPPSDLPAISLRLFDQDDNTVICDATVTLTDADFDDAAIVVGSGAQCRYQGAFDRPGTYALSASKAGYATFTNPSVVVDADACGDPVTRELDFPLDPL